MHISDDFDQPPDEPGGHPDSDVTANSTPAAAMLPRADEDEQAPVISGGPTDLAARADDYLADGFGQ